MIRAALTTEQWVRGEFWRGTRNDMGKKGWNWIDQERVYGDDEFVGISQYHDSCAVSKPESRHALAAFALARQPFGFTRADVELLRVGVNVNLPKDGSCDSVAARVYELADRIEALLPPHG